MTDRRDDEQADDGLSSEDLLREAKERYRVDDVSSSVEASPPDTELPTAEEIAAELAVAAAEAQPDEPTIEGQAAEERAADEPHAEPESDAIRFRVPDPGIPTGLPTEPVDVDSDEILAGVPAPAEVTAKAGGLLSTLWRNRWIVVAAIIGISVVSNLADSSEPIGQLAVGDCFDNPSGDEVTSIDPVDCAETHDLEVFALVPLGSGDFPGDVELLGDAFGSCLDRFEGYVGRDYSTSSLDMFPFTPTRRSWDNGDRNAICVVYEEVPGTDGEEIRPRSGSVRGSGL